MSQEEREKSPWIWKAAIVMLPVGLGVSVIIALYLKISKGERNDMAELEYLAGNLDPKVLRDSVTKLEDYLGARDYSEQGARALRGAAALVEGSLGPSNLGYVVASDDGLTREGRIWKNYWVDSPKGGRDGALLVWVNYAEEEESGSVAALLSLAEWMRGRSFEKEVRLAFLVEENSLPVVAADWSPEELTIMEVRDLGMGRQGLVVEEAGANYTLSGDKEDDAGADWKLTVGWEYFELQVDELCRQVSELAGEKVVFED